MTCSELSEFEGIKVAKRRYEVLWRQELFSRKEKHNDVEHGDIVDASSVHRPEGVHKRQGDEEPRVGSTLMSTKQP